MAAKKKAPAKKAAKKPAKKAKPAKPPIPAPVPAPEVMTFQDIGDEFDKLAEAEGDYGDTRDAMIDLIYKASKAATGVIEKDIARVWPEALIKVNRDETVTFEQCRRLAEFFWSR